MPFFSIVSADRICRERRFSLSMKNTTLKDISLIFKNIVFIELLRRGYKVTVGKAGEFDMSRDDIKHCNKKEEPCILLRELLGSILTLIFSEQESKFRCNSFHPGSRSDNPLYWCTFQYCTPLQFHNPCN